MLEENNLISSTLNVFNDYRYLKKNDIVYSSLEILGIKDGGKGVRYIAHSIRNAGITKLKSAKL